MVAPSESLVACEATLSRRLCDARVAKEEWQRAQRCLDDLGQILQDLFASGSLFPFGSMCNGFAVSGCDLDVAFDRMDDQDEGNSSATEMLEYSVPAIRSNSKFEVVDVVRAAMIPIIRIRYEDALDVDVSFRNRSPLSNSQLLRAYSQLHPVVHDLVVLVKLWAKTNGVCGAVDGHLSAYSLTLMAIYFLQVDPMISLPCLSSALFKGDGDIPSEAQREWSCRLPTTQVLSRFFAFFVRDFDWGMEVVSVRHGARGAASLGVFEKLRGKSDFRLHVEDPFLTERNLNCALSIENEHKLFDCLTGAFFAMQACGIPEGLAFKNGRPHQQRPINKAKASLESGEAASPQSGLTANTFGAMGGAPRAQIGLGDALTDVACSTPSAGWSFASSNVRGRDKEDGATSTTEPSPHVSCVRGSPRAQCLTTGTVIIWSRARREAMGLGEISSYGNSLACRDAQDDAFINDVPEEAAGELRGNGADRSNHPALPRPSFMRLRTVNHVPDSHSCAHQPQRLNDLSSTRHSLDYLPGRSLLQEASPSSETRTRTQSLDQISAICDHGEQCDLEAIHPFPWDLSDAKTHNADISRCHYDPDHVSKRSVGDGRPLVAPPAPHEVPSTVLTKRWSV